MSDINVKLDLITLAHDIDPKRFSAAFFGEDDIGAVIRCHYEVEKAAIYALEVLTDGRWKRLRSQYLSEKLNLLEVLGAPPRLLAPARTLNNQRNDFAHEGLDTLDPQKELDLTRGVRAFFPQFHDDYSIVLHGKREFTGKFRECSPRQKYVVSAAILSALIGSIPVLMKEHRDKVQSIGEIRKRQPVQKPGA
ncbi:MAG: hypothetical protein E5Y30_15830 [Mesorhizobium sp.]|nr:MAG: hypothetical protein E5Y30_15830 [Mesorhizobium sp.]